MVNFRVWLLISFAVCTIKKAVLSASKLGRHHSLVHGGVEVVRAVDGAEEARHHAVALTVEVQHAAVGDVLVGGQPQQPPPHADRVNLAVVVQRRLLVLRQYKELLITCNF